MKDSLPFLVTVPHGGTVVPPEVADRILLDWNDLIEDADAYTAELFNVSDLVYAFLPFVVFRAIVDPSRADDQLPPEFPDGCIKSHTCFGKQVYKQGSQPNNARIKTLLQTYYVPYHDKITAILQDDRVVMLLDCHSMAPIGPPIAPDTGKSRLLVCIGNNDNTSSSYQVAELMATLSRSVMGLDYHQVTINQPFKGGYITKKYGNNPKPVLQIEVNRKLFVNSISELSEDSGYRRNLVVQFNRSFREILSRFHKELLIV